MAIKTIISIFLLIAISFNTKANDLCDFQRGIFTQAQSLYERGQFLLSATQYSLLFNSKCRQVASRARYNYSLSMYKLGETQELVEQYRYFSKHDHPYHKQVKTVLSLATEDIGDVKVARWLELAQKKEANPLSISDLRIRKAYEDYMAQGPYKNPYIAAIGSALVPGLGQLYNGTYQSAAISFVLNSLFLWSTINLADNDLDGAAVASGLVFSVTYLGNILNAVRGSKKINDLRMAPMKSRLQQEYFSELKNKELK